MKQILKDILNKFIFLGVAHYDQLVLLDLLGKKQKHLSGQMLPVCL